MCLDGEFKLCSCDPESLTEDQIGWKLERFDPSVKMPRKLGKVAMPRWTPEQLQSIDFIVTSLNTENRFDLEIDPDGTYELSLRFAADDKWFQFHHARGEWRHKSPSIRNGKWHTEGQGEVQLLEAAPAE